MRAIVSAVTFTLVVSVGYFIRLIGIPWFVALPITLLCGWGAFEFNAYLVRRLQ